MTNGHDSGVTMKMHTIERDGSANLALLRDEADPPRFYVQERRRRELIAIGDEAEARSRFAIRRNRSRRLPQQLGLRSVMTDPAHRPGIDLSGIRSGRHQESCHCF